MSRLLPIVLIALALLGASCSDDSCSDNGSSLPLATFYVGNTQQTITGLTVMGIGVPGDSLLLDSASVKEAFLPLRASTTTTSFMLRHWRSNGSDWLPVTDTLTLDYQPIEYFHSIECGAMYNFDVKRVGYTTHGIDSVILLNNLFTNSRTPALRIHFAQ